MVFGPPICRGKVWPIFQTCIFKSHLLPTIWPDMVEFRSASSAGSWRKEERKKEESLVKYMSANNYVGRPNYHYNHHYRSHYRLCLAETKATEPMLSIRWRYWTCSRDQLQQKCRGLSPYRRWREWGRCGEDKRRRNPRQWWTSAEYDMTDTTVHREAAYPATGTLVHRTCLCSQHHLLDSRCCYLNVSQK